MTNQRFRKLLREAIRRAMKPDQIIDRFKQILNDEYGKVYTSDITVARAIEILRRVLEEAS